MTAKRTRKNRMIPVRHSKRKKRTRIAMTRRQLQQRRRKRMIWLMLIIMLLLAFIMFKSCQRVVNLEKIDYPSYVSQQYIDVDGTSRSGADMRMVNDIVIHYVANPGSTAQGNRDYFDSAQSRVSAHFVVGLDGEVIQCIPLDEQSAASNDRNGDTISIEVCHPDSTGKFSDVTYDRLIELTAWLCSEFGLDEDDVIRHYDITGKNCPKYFVENEEAWEQFRRDVKEAL